MKIVFAALGALVIFIATVWYMSIQNRINAKTVPTPGITPSVSTSADAVKPQIAPTIKPSISPTKGIVNSQVVPTNKVKPGEQPPLPPNAFIPKESE